MTLDVAGDRCDGFRFRVVKIVVIDRVVADARADREFRIGERLSVLLQFDGEVSDVAVAAENKSLFRFDTVRAGESELDRTFLAGSERYDAFRSVDLIITCVEVGIKRLIAGNKPEG